MAARYAVGADFTWNSTAGTKWATASGGAGGASAPTAADDVFFDANSPNVTLGASVPCRSVNFTGYTRTFTHNASVTLSIGDATAGAGNVAVLLVAAMTYTVGGTNNSVLSFVSTSAAQQTLTFAGKPTGQLAFAASGNWIFTDGWTGAAPSGNTTLTHTSGAVTTNDQPLTCAVVTSSGSGVRTFSLGASVITVGASSAVAWNTAVSTNLTLNGGTASIVLSGTAAVFNGGGASYAGVSISFTASTGGATNIQGGNLTCANLTKTGAASKTDVFSSSGNITVSGTLTVNGNSSVNRVLVQSNVAGTQRSITAAVVVASNVDFMDIAAGGDASWDLSAITGGSGDAGGTSGITFTPAATQTHTASPGGNASDATKWTSRVPLPQDDVVVDVNTTGVLTMDMPRIGRNIDFTGFTGTADFSSVATTAYGSVTLAAGMTITGLLPLTVAGRGNHTFTSAGQTLTMSLTIAAATGTYSLLDGLTISRSTTAFTLSSGTFTTNNHTVALTSTTSGTVSIIGGTLNMGSSLWSIATTAALTVWTATAGAVINAGTSEIRLINASALTRTFAGGGKTYGTLTYTVVNSPGALVLTGANTFAVLNVGPGRAVTLPSATTTTLNSAAGWQGQGSPFGYLHLPGTTGNFVTAPDSAALSFTSDFDIRMRLALDDWTPGAAAELVAKWEGAQRSYLFFVNATGTLALFTAPTGAETGNGVTSTASVGAADGAAIWLRVTYRNSDGRVQFFTGADSPAEPGVWTQLGADRTLPVAGIFDSSSTLGIGGRPSTGTAPMAGKLYRVVMYADLAGATKAFDADFTTKAVGANTFVESSANAATVTINGTLAQAGDGRVMVASSTPGVQHLLAKAGAAVSADYLDISDSNAGGGAVWYAGANSVNRANNTGWLFKAPNPPLSLAGAVTPAAAASRQGRPSPSGSVEPVSAPVPRAVMSVFASALTPTGATLRASATGHSGVLASTGGVARQAAVAASGAVTPEGVAALLRQVALLLGGTLAPAGVALRSSARKEFSAIVGASGTGARLASRRLVRSLAAAGATVRRGQGARSGAVTPTGSSLRQGRQDAAGVLTPTATTSKDSSRAAGGALAVAGAHLSDTAVLADGSVTASSAFARRPMRLVAGELGPDGTTSRRAQATPGGLLGPAGDSARRAERFLARALAPGGEVSRAASWLAEAVLTFVSDLAVGAPPPVVRTTIVGGLRARLIRDSFFYMLRDTLEAQGWFEPDRAHEPIQLVPEPYGQNEPVPLNTVAVSAEDVESEPAEMGSDLTVDSWPFWVDVYAEDDSVGLALANDIRDALRGKMPLLGRGEPTVRVYDYREADPPEVFVVQIEDVALDRARSFPQPWEQHWFSVRCMVVDEYADSIS